MVSSRAGVVGGAGALGLVAGCLSVLTAPLTGLGTETAFAVGALLFGFGLVGWSGSVLVGETVERASGLLNAGDWTEADSRRAMARIGGAGAGLMVGVTFAATLV